MIPGRLIWEGVITSQVTRKEEITSSLRKYRIRLRVRGSFLKYRVSGYSGLDTHRMMYPMKKPAKKALIRELPRSRVNTAAKKILRISSGIIRLLSPPPDRPPG
jgi:hypothetical protein